MDEKIDSNLFCLAFITLQPAAVNLMLWLAQSLETKKGPHQTGYITGGAQHCSLALVDTKNENAVSF